jgi:hypothetical protein
MPRAGAMTDTSSVIVRLPEGSLFRCSFLCNVFHRPPDDADVVICNACGDRYRGERSRGR